MNLSVISLFPSYFDLLKNTGVTARAFEEKKTHLEIINPRDFADSDYKSVDDSSFGGGSQVMRADILKKAIDKALGTKSKKDCKVIHFSPRGMPLNQKKVKELAKERNLILLCSRYEAVDERLIDEMVDHEISIGDYVLSGGELAALVLIDAIARHLEGVISKDSLKEESFEIAKNSENLGLLEYPHYTKPQNWQGIKVPEILLSGNHQKIKDWRLKQALLKTWQTRPDLIEALIGKAKFENKYQKQLDELLKKLINELKN